MSFKNLKLSLFLKKEYLLFLIILLFGSALRLQGVFSNTFAFTYDVGRDMLALWDIAYAHKLVLIGATTGIQGVFYGPWWYYILTPFFILFKGNPQGIAFIMAASGIITIIFAFWLGRKLGGSTLGLILSLLVSISPILVSESSQIWNPNLAPLLVILIFLCLDKIYSHGQKTGLKYLFLLGMLLALNIDFEILWGTIFSIGTFLSLLVVLKKQFFSKKIIALFFGGLLILLPRIIFEFRHGFLMTKSFFMFLGAKTLEDKSDLYHFLQNRFYIHLDQFNQAFFYNYQSIALLLFIFMIVTSLIFYKKLQNKLKNIVLTLYIIIGTFYICSLIFTHALWPHYFVGLPIVYILLLSVSLFVLIKNRKSLIIVGLIIICILGLNLASTDSLNIFLGKSFIGNASVYRNQLEVVDYVYNQANGRQFKYVVYTPPVFDYTYRYLFKWYGPQKYHYGSNEEAHLAYFILEPDPGYPVRPELWLDARKNDGKIIQSKTLQSGIIIQTRVH